MSKKINRLLEIILTLIIIYVFLKVFPYIKELFSFFIKILIPFLVSFAFAFTFEPLIEKLEKYKIKRKISIILIVIFFCIIIYFTIRFLIPNLIKQLNIIIDSLPNYLSNLTNLINKVNHKFSTIIESYLIDYSHIEQFLTNKLTVIIDKFTILLQKSFSYLISIAITPVLMIYFLNDYKKIENFIKKFFLEHQLNNLYHVLSQIKEAVRNYLKGVFFVMIIFSISAGLTFLLIGLEQPFIFGLIIGITDIIPYIGPYIGGIIVVIFAIASKSVNPLLVILTIVILQFLESNFLVPKIQSKTMNTNPILVLLSVAFFGELFGLIGLILAVPLEKIVEISINNYLEIKKKKKFNNFHLQKK